MLEPKIIEPYFFEESEVFVSFVNNDNLYSRGIVGWAIFDKYDIIGLDEIKGNSFSIKDFGQENYEKFRQIFDTCSICRFPTERKIINCL